MPEATGSPGLADRAHRQHGSQHGPDGIPDILELHKRGQKYSFVTVPSTLF